MYCKTRDVRFKKKNNSISPFLTQITLKLKITLNEIKFPSYTKLKQSLCTKNYPIKKKERKKKTGIFLGKRTKKKEMDSLTR